MLCCVRVIVNRKALGDKYSKYSKIGKGRLKQKTLTLELHQKANIPPVQCDYFRRGKE